MFAGIWGCGRRFFSFPSLVSVSLADVVTSHDSASPIGRTRFSKPGASMEHGGREEPGGMLRSEYSMEIPGVV